MFAPTLTDASLQADFERAWEMVLRGLADLSHEVRGVFGTLFERAPTSTTIAVAARQWGGGDIRELANRTLQRLGLDVQRFPLLVRDGKTPRTVHLDYFDDGDHERAEAIQQQLEALYHEVFLRAPRDEQLLLLANEAGRADERLAPLVAQAADLPLFELVVLCELVPVLGDERLGLAQLIVRRFPTVALGYLLVVRALGSRGASETELEAIYEQGRRAAARPAVFLARTAASCWLDGRRADALRLFDEASADDPAWPGLAESRAVLAAVGGDRTQVDALVRHAVAASSSTDELESALRNEGMIELAIEVHIAAGQREASADELRENLGLWATPFPPQRDERLARALAAVPAGRALRHQLDRFNVRAARAAEQARCGDPTEARALLAVPEAGGTHHALKIAIAEGSRDLAALDAVVPFDRAPTRVLERAAVYVRMGAVDRVRMVAEIAATSRYASIADRAHLASVRAWLAAHDGDVDGVAAAARDMQRYWPGADRHHPIVARVAEAETMAATALALRRDRARLERWLSGIVDAMAHDEMLAIDAERRPALIAELADAALSGGAFALVAITTRLAKQLVASELVDDVFADDDTLRERFSTLLTIGRES